MTRDAWIRACANHFSWTPKRTSTICSQHFEPSCFIIQANNMRRLKQFALPTLELAKVLLFSYFVGLFPRLASQLFKDDSLPELL